MDCSRWLPWGGEASEVDGFHVGALVALCGLRRGARLVPGTEDLPGSTLQAPTATDFNSTLAQLVEYHEDQKRWLLATLQGVLLLASSRHFRLAAANELKEYDVVIGPASRPRFTADRLAQVLLDKGFAKIRPVISKEDCDEALGVSERLDAEGLYERPRKGFESGYLGRNSKGKICTFDLRSQDAPDAALASPALGKLDDNVAILSSMLSGYAAEHMGFLVHSRTPLLLRKNLDGPADEAQNPPKEPSNAEVTSFLNAMQRRRLAVVQNLGPSSGKLVIFPPEEEDDDNFQGVDPKIEEEEEDDDDDENIERRKPLKLQLQPGDMVMLVCSEFDFEYSSASDHVLLQSWFLDSPIDFVMEGTVSGNLEAITQVVKGPPPPKSNLETISLVGMGVRNPGHSDSADKYWMCTRHSGGDGMLQIPFTRYDLEAYAEWRLDRQSALNMGKMYCRHQGHLEGIEFFDASFFNISGAEAGGMDPEQRLTLETGWCALHDAGYERMKLQRSGGHIGVFVGISGSDWHWVPLPPNVMGGMGGTEAVIAGRVTFCLNIKGPAQIINTACSASLVSMHSGKLHLLFPNDRMESTLTTGISINTTPHVFMGNCTTNALSFMGRSFSFDKSADGFGRSEGTSAACFKIMGYTEEVYGILAGSQANHDGRSASLTAPNGPAQERCIRSVLAETKLEPPEIDCFECHGTGTSLGDPIEVGAFRRLYNRKPRSNPVLATTSKTNLGHTEGGAGIAGFFKCILMCMHTECAPNIHSRELNPHLDTDGFPCYFTPESCTMTADTCYAGVSSFGVSGTNGHCLAYGRNTLTSRGGGQQDYNKTMAGKIKAAAPNVITDGKTDWRQWVNLGKPHCEQPGEEYEVEALQDGSVTWRKVERQPLRKPEGPYFIQGSFTDWTMDQMSVDMTVLGLHSFEFELGDSGEETFQIVYSLDENMVFYPAEPRCRRRTAQILGPGKPSSKESAWLIRGEPGTYYRVEFFVFEDGARQTLNWMAVKD